MADSKRYLDWYSKSEKDLKGAKILLKYRRLCNARLGKVL